MSLRTPLSRAHGLGSAKEGVSHWWAQRLTSIALAPLVIWFAFSIAMLSNMEYATLLNWIQSPFNTVMLILMTIAGFYHMQLGLQVIVEDYVHSEWLKFSSIMLINFACIVFAVASIVAVLKISI